MVTTRGSTNGATGFFAAERKGENKDENFEKKNNPDDTGPVMKT